MKEAKHMVSLACGCFCLTMGGAAYAHAGPGSCSEADQQSFYTQLLSDDQKVRALIAAEPEASSERRNALVQQMLDQDTVNQRRLDAAVEACGWPDAAGFLNSKLEAAFLVVQHSPLAYTERYRERIEQAFAAGKIPERRMEDFRRYLAWKRKP